MTVKREKLSKSPAKAPAKSKVINVKHAMDMILDDYFKNLNGQKPRNIHKMIMGHAEHRLIEGTMKRAEYNQSKAAEMLGLNRSTLRSKLERYKIPKRTRRRAADRK